ncbi:MAG: ATP-binding cassette domain-containing protein [Oscillospiraceae bacterium]|jgi:NHLM bacteriocin system ABC transporter ATP-binding protein|nr:ATP-binding cassette domain-containing protein [Oscillospiraceae bacterium]
MGWVDEQIKSRIKNDKNAFEDSMMDLSSVILGKRAVSKNIKNERQKTTNAIEEILKYYKIKIKEIPKELENLDEQLDYALRPTGIMRRTVSLEGKWWTDAVGAMIGRTKKGDVVALMPSGISGYRFFDYEASKFIKLSDLTRDLLIDEAICFYVPFPLKEIGIKDLLLFTIKTLSRADIAMILLSTAAVTFIGMLTPMLTKLQYEYLIPSGKINLITPIATILVGASISSSLIGITKSLIMNRVQTKMSIYAESATMGRVISLPASFFKQFSAGDLASRVSGIQQLCIQLTDAFLTTGLSTLFSFVYIFQMGTYGPAMVMPGLAIILFQAVFAVFGTFLGLKNSRKKMNINVNLSGLLFSIFNGIQKIKLSGSERRAFSQWSNAYKNVASLEYDPPFILRILPILGTMISLVGTLILYYFAGISKITIANYSAFNMAYGQVNGAIMSVVSISTMFTSIKPFMEMVEPILKTKPEISENKKIVTSISGSIELQHISFKYIEKGPLILDDVNLKINTGQYVAIVGKTGCGKSTLMRLLLGFEKPILGSIYFDGVDIEKIDLKSLRQHIGVVMQNGKLFSGDVFSNIIISAPWSSMEEAWEAAEIAGVANDIKDMPMGMNTLISEGQGGISGGQRQRLMIARAIAPKPKILMLDEATSALDNVTQKQVSDSLEKLKSTRIVIAHRLSTIKHCDRIIMLDSGKIIEDGSYEELIKLNGQFAELVKRQRLDSDTQQANIEGEESITADDNKNDEGNGSSIDNDYKNINNKSTEKDNAFPFENDTRDNNNFNDIQDDNNKGEYFTTTDDFEKDFEDFLRTDTKTKSRLNEKLPSGGGHKNTLRTLKNDESSIDLKKLKTFQDHHNKNSNQENQNDQTKKNNQDFKNNYIKSDDLDSDFKLFDEPNDPNP